MNKALNPPLALAPEQSMQQAFTLVVWVPIAAMDPSG